MKIYDKYMSVIGYENSFTYEEKEKILYHIVKNFSVDGDRYYHSKSKSYEKERHFGKDEYILYITKDIDSKSYYIQCGEQNITVDNIVVSHEYDIAIKTGGERHSFGSDEFNRLFKYF